jgi:hypothetical protein
VKGSANYIALYAATQHSIKKGHCLHTGQRTFIAVIQYRAYNNIPSEYLPGEDRLIQLAEFLLCFVICRMVLIVLIIFSG